MKRYYICVLVILLPVLSLLPLSPVSAEAVTLDVHVGSSHLALTDGDFTTYSTVESSLTISAQRDIHSLYILFRDKPVDLTIHNGDRSLTADGAFLQQVYALDTIAGKQLTLTFAEPVAIADIFALSDGELPSFVHRWNPPHDRADLLLISTHADDEQLYFAGLLPYYAGERGYRVQVAYFTDHCGDLHRRHELLNGLWTVGVHHYPVFSSFPDRKCADYQTALKRFEKDGILTNSDMGEQQLKKYCKLSKECEEILKNAYETLHLSPRARSRIIKVARTIADMELYDEIRQEHILEAISYRH